VARQGANNRRTRSATAAEQPTISPEVERKHRRETRAPTATLRIMLRRFQQLRPVLLWRGLVAKRDRPDLRRLSRETDSERFLWAILPHAARSFAASIAALPRRKARAAAVAYLYCRMLDTYEDLYPDSQGRVAELERFGRRLDQKGRPPPTPIPAALVRDDRDRLHLLLVSRCDLVDEVFDRLPEDQQKAIADLVRSMAQGMVWSEGVFARQDGVLADQAQLVRYCHNVIGYPALFVLTLLDDAEPGQRSRKDALRVSEMVQLANVTRDIEKDLDRGIAYHPSLSRFRRGAGTLQERDAAIREVREELLGYALAGVPAYVRLFEDPSVRRSPAARAAAVMLLSFTDLHYRGCMEGVGRRAWRGPGGPFSVVFRAWPALISSKAARRSITRIERNFLTAGRAIGTQLPIQSVGGSRGGD
jgi:phytoene/squalene synthetase